MKQLHFFVIMLRATVTVIILTILTVKFFQLHWVEPSSVNLFSALISSVYCQFNFEKRFATLIL